MRAQRVGKDFRVLLAIQHGNRYGLDIAKAAGVRPGALYPSLSRLEAQGMIEGEWVAQLGGRRSRRAYRVAERLRSP